MEYGRLTGLVPEEYQDPGEVYYMKALKAIPIMDKLVGAVIQAQTEVDLKSEDIGNSCRITARNNPRVYRLYLKALERLDMPEEYPLYSKLAYEYNAYAAGVANPYIMLYTSEIKDMNDQELLTTIGHELGHIKSQHMLYHNMADRISQLFQSIGLVGTTTAQSIYFLLMQWVRHAEFTADRAGMIAAGDYESTVTLWTKLMGGSEKIEQVNISIDEILTQVDQFDIEKADILGKIMYLYYTSAQDHPWPILRIKMAKEWYDSGTFEQLIKRHI